MTSADDSTERVNVRARGRALRQRLGLDENVHGAPALGYLDLSDELLFGQIWCRDGLPLSDRMIATLAALCARERDPLLAPYAAAALRVGLQPNAVREIFIQVGLYAGFPTAEKALRAAESMFAAQGLAAPDATAAEVSARSLDAAGKDKMNELHGERSSHGYAAPGHPTTEALYTLALRYGYGVLWNRPGLTRRERFICAVAAFTALRLTTQLEKFAQSAQSQDLTRAELIEIIMQTAPYAGFPPALNVLTLLTAET